MSNFDWSQIGIPPKEWLDAYGIVLVSKEFWEQIVKKLELKIKEESGIKVEIKR